MRKNPDSPQNGFHEQLHYLQVTTNGGDVNDGSKSEHDTNQKSKKTDNVNSDSSEADESEWL